MRSPASSLDRLLTEPAQRDAVPGDFRVVLDHAEQIPPRRIGIEPQQQIGRRQMKEAQRVRLDDLTAMHDFPQLHCGRRDRHAHDRLARLGRGDQVADRANPADPRGDRGHLIEWPAFHEFFEAAQLGDVEEGFRDLAVIVEMNADLRVTFDPRDRVDDDGLHQGLLTKAQF